MRKRKIPTLNFYHGQKQENIVFCCACFPRLYIFVPDTQYTVDLSSHIAYLISHTRGRIHISILQGINATVIIPSAKISNDFGNLCIALDQGTFAFFLFFDTITNHHRIDTIKSQIIPLKFFQYPTSIRLGVNSEMMIFRRTL